MLKQGTVVAFDEMTWTATVRLDESLASYRRNVPVASHLSAELLPAGVRVALLVFDEIVGDGLLVVAAYPA
jgi:hypothetical protein